MASWDSAEESEPSMARLVCLQQPFLSYILQFPALGESETIYSYEIFHFQPNWIYTNINNRDSLMMTTVVRGVVPLRGFRNGPDRAWNWTIWV